MPQVSLYLDEPSMENLREDAAHAEVSLSKYVAQLIQNRRERGEWPQGYWDIYGALKDESFQVPEDSDASLDGPLPSF